MRRRLPFEPEQLVEQLTSWIAWRYAGSDQNLVLTSAPTSIPQVLQDWMPEAVWRLAWQSDGAAVLFGIAPGSGPGRYFIARHDGIDSRREGVFDRLADGSWAPLQGDDLAALSSKRPRQRWRLSAAA